MACCSPAPRPSVSRSTSFVNVKAASTWILPPRLPPAGEIPVLFSRTTRLVQQAGCLFGRTIDRGGGVNPPSQGQSEARYRSPHSRRYLSDRLQVRTQFGLQLIRIVINN